MDLLFKLRRQIADERNEGRPSRSVHLSSMCFTVPTCLSLRELTGPLDAVTLTRNVGYFDEWCRFHVRDVSLILDDSVSNFYPFVLVDSLTLPSTSSLLSFFLYSVFLYFGLSTGISVLLFGIDDVCSNLKKNYLFFGNFPKFVPKLMTSSF